MSVLDDYYSWLKSISFLNQLDNNIARISLPFLDRNNDYTEIYAVKQSEREYLLTDDGATCGELEFSGFEFNDKRLEMLNTIVNSHGVSIDSNKAIFTVADIDSLPQKKHMLVQCMMKVSDLFELRRSKVTSLFTEDIAEFLDENDIRYTPDVMLIGKSKLPCHFDFIIPSNKTAPERLIRGMNRLDNNSVRLLIFSWEDTRDSRSRESKFYAFINDIELQSRTTVISSLKEYDITPVMWSSRVESVNSLAA